MAYWLMKSEPSAYSWSDLERDGGTMWDGVRNNAARLNLRAMKAGDEALFYHSMDERAVVGIMRIAGTGQPDGEDGSWVKVPVEPVRPHGLDHAAAGPLLAPDVVHVEIAAPAKQLDRPVAGRVQATAGSAVSCRAHRRA